MSEVCLSPDVAAVAETVVAIRRDLHQHPELAFEEHRTAGVVADRLRALGLAPQTGVAGTGVVAVIDGGAGDGPTVLLRADMDALPVDEANDVPYRSQVPGRMHACGHDGHTAILLGVAEVLCGRRDRLAGRVKLIFQPAEESPGGAEPMIAAGVLAEPPVDLAFGLHLWASLPTGAIGVGAGPQMASSDMFTVTIHGHGGHAAMPSECVDPVVVAAHLVTALQTIVSRSVPPLSTAVVTVAQLHAGHTFNVIPDSATLNGTVRTFDEAVRARVAERFAELVAGVCAAFGATGEIDWTPSYPVLVNDGAMAELVRAAAREVVGDDQVREATPSLGAEDFAYFLRQVPGCYFQVGLANAAKGTGAPHHNPRFDLDEEALPIAVEVLVRVTERALANR